MNADLGGRLTANIKASEATSDMSQIRALFISCSNSGVAHWRFDNFINSMHRNKYALCFNPWFDKARTENHPWEMDITEAEYKHRILGELWDHAKKADVVVFQMLHTPQALNLFLAMKDALPNVPVVTEIDDNILSTPAYNPADASYQSGSVFRGVAVEQFRKSDAMIVSTPYLKEVYSEFCSRIYVMPNSLDFRIFDNLKFRRNKDLIRIGWAGGASHDEDLRIIEPVVHKILAKHPNVRFCFVHGAPQFLKNLDRVEIISQWTRIDRYPQFLASRSVDIWLAPLVDNAFNRAKSNLRWVEAAGLKAPCVASKVGHFAETISHPDDGLLCESEADWMHSLSWLVSDENARRKIGKNANSKARKLFNVDINSATYAKTLREIADRGQIVPADNYDHVQAEKTISEGVMQ